MGLFGWLFGDDDLPPPKPVDRRALARLGERFPPAYIHNKEVPLLPDSDYADLQFNMRRATRSMRELGVQEFGYTHNAPNYWRDRWQRQQRIGLSYDTPERLADDVAVPRTEAAKIVARGLEARIRSLEGLGSRVRYEPWNNAMDRHTAGLYQPLEDRIFLNTPAYTSPSRLATVLLHEGRHMTQWRDFGPNSEYERPSTLADADAYLFQLEHRRETGLQGRQLAYFLHDFRSACDVNDRLAQGHHVENQFSATQSMDPVRRSDLELRYSFIEPQLHLELGGRPVLSAMPPAFSYGPMRPFSGAAGPPGSLGVPLTGIGH